MAAAEVVTLRVTADAPLLRRGLVRAATAAGFTVVTGSAGAQASLHMGGAPAGARAGPELDIAVESGCVVVTFRRTPSRAAVVRLHALLGALLEDATRREQPRSARRRGGSTPSR